MFDIKVYHGKYFYSSFFKKRSVGNFLFLSQAPAVGPHKKDTGVWNKRVDFVAMSSMLLTCDSHSVAVQLLNIRNTRTFSRMKPNLLTVREQVIIVRQFQNIGITSTLQAYYLPTAQALPSRFYNGRIVYQYKKLRVGLTTLRKQPRCRIVLNIDVPVLPF